MTQPKKQVTKTMAGCGYVCPQCEGLGHLSDGRPCDWCQKPQKSVTKNASCDADKMKETEQEEWIKSVHQGPCCSDLSS